MMGRYTVRGEKIEFYRQLGTFVVAGEAQVSDGHESKRGDSARISFRDGRPKVEVVQ